MIKHFLQPFVICIFICSWTVIAWSTTDEIIVGVSTGYPPYYYEHDGEFTGVCIELINNVAQSLNLKIIYKKYPWKRLLSSAEHGYVDAIMPLFKTTEREQFLYFSNLDLLYEENSFFTWNEKEIHFDGNLENITPYTVGVVSDYSYGDKFDHFESLNKVTTRDDKHLIEMFTHNRFEIGVGNKDVILFNAKSKNISQKIKFLTPYITKKPLYIGFSKEKKHSVLAGKFADVLQQFKSTSKYQEILKKYGMMR